MAGELEFKYEVEIKARIRDRLFQMKSRKN